MAIHDQGWGERPVFGKIRFMNFQGCKRKFDTEAFILQYVPGYQKSTKERPKAKKAATGAKRESAGDPNTKSSKIKKMEKK